MNLEALNWFDVILGGTIIVSALVGIARGLLREVLSVVAWVAALWAAFTFSDQGGAYIVNQGWLDDQHIAYFAAFGCIFLITLFLFGLFNMLIGSIFKATGLGGIDRLLGMLFGLARGGIIATLIVFFARFILVEDFDAWKTSKLKGPFIGVSDWAYQKIPDSVRTLIDKTGAWISADSGNTLVDPNTPAPYNLELSSLDAQDAQPSRPQLSVEEQRQQSTQSNALSEIGNDNLQPSQQFPDEPPLLLESYPQGQ